jgi:hypothetical protein
LLSSHCPCFERFANAANIPAASRIVGPGELDRPVTRIKYGSQEWHRVEGETEASFKARAQAEALLPPGSSRLVMIIE